MSDWTAIPSIGSYVRLIEFCGAPALQSAAMLADGTMESECCDVSPSAFANETELHAYAVKVAEHLGAAAIKAAIRG